MAVLSFTGINKSSSKQGTTAASKNIKNISSTLLGRTTFRKNISANIIRYKKRREDYDRSSNKRSEILAPTIVSRPTGARGLALSQTGGNFLTRITQFIGFVSAGWVLSNMPTWIAGAKELSNRIQSLSSTFTGFVDNIWNLISDIGTLANSLFQNMVNFDLTDSSSRVRNSMVGLTDTLDSMGDQISEVFSTLTQPFTNVPPLGTKGEEGAYPEVQPQGQPSAPSGGGAGGTKYPLLAETVVKGEGGINSVNRGNAGDTPGGAKSIFGKNLTDMTVGEIMQAQREGRVFAVGKYQFIPDTLSGAVAYTKISPDTKFNSSTQNKLFDYLIDVKRPEVGAYINGKSNDKRTAIQQLAREFASIGLEYPEAGRSRGQSRYSGTGGNRASISPEEAGEALDKQRKGGSSQQQITRQTPQKPNLGRLGFSVGEKAGYSSRRGRVHAGRDIAIAAGTPVSVISDATITDVGNDIGGYGYYVAYVDSKGIEHFYGHLREMPKVAKGQKLSSGTIVGYVGSTGSSTGPHLHWEVSPQIGEVGRPRRNVIDPIEYGFSSSAPFSTSSQSTATIPLIPSSSPSSQPSTDVGIDSNSNTEFLNQVLESMDVASKKQKIVLINDLQTSTSQSSGGSSGGGDVFGSISESSVVNTFIKNKLLLDLNYL